MKKLGLLIMVTAVLIAGCKKEEDNKIEFKDFNDSLSYAIGNDIANNFKQNKLDSLNIDILSLGIKNNFADDTTIMNNETTTQILMIFSQKMRVEQEAKMLAENKIKFKANLDDGQLFLSENVKKEGVETTESGLQYKIIKKGNGSSPVATDKVKVHYEGTLLDGTKFDSSYDRGEPAEFGVDQVISGWTEALQLMTEGSTWELYIPYNLAYGERGSGSIKPFSALVFKVELLKIVK